MLQFGAVLSTSTDFNDLPGPPLNVSAVCFLPRWSQSAAPQLWSRSFCNGAWNGGLFGSNLRTFLVKYEGLCRSVQLLLNMVSGYRKKRGHFFKFEGLESFEETLFTGCKSISVQRYFFGILQKDAVRCLCRRICEVWSENVRAFVLVKCWELLGRGFNGGVLGNIPGCFPLWKPRKFGKDPAACCSYTVSSINPVVNSASDQRWVSKSHQLCPNQNCFTLESDASQTFAASKGSFQSPPHSSVGSIFSLKRMRM